MISRRLAVMGVGMTALVAGCAGTVSSSPPSGAGSPPHSLTITIKNFSFNPSSATLAAGGTVTWRNRDTVAHTATAANGSFNSHDIDPGHTYQVVLNKPGTYSYMCEIHQYMTATITVKG